MTQTQSAEIGNDAPAPLSSTPPVVDILGLKVHALTMDQTVAHITAAISRGERVQHCAINVAKMVKMMSDPVLAGDVASSGLRNADGMGVVLAARALTKQGLPERVTGVDLMEAMVAAAAREGFGIFILGAKAEVLDKAIETLEARHPGLNVAGRHHGYFTEADEPGIVEAINASGAAALFVAMPTPRKEHFIARNRDKLAPALLMGVGGTIDVVAGKVERAPGWVQSWGFEWMFRLVQEPKKMCWRYASTNSAFALIMAKALAYRAVGRRYKPLSSVERGVISPH